MIGVFTVATFIAFTQSVDPTGSLAMASIVWLVARVLHGVFYIAQQAVLRVLSFTVSLAMSGWIIVMAVSLCRTPADRCEPCLSVGLSSPLPTDAHQVAESRF